jgi:hypothetical protein
MSHPTMTTTIRYQMLMKNPTIMGTTTTMI